MATAKKVGYAAYRLSPLKAITAAAKKLYKTGKYAKWTDAVKAASKGIKPTKTATKKSAVKKAVPKKKAAVKKAVTQQKLFGVKTDVFGRGPAGVKRAMLKDLANAIVTLENYKSHPIDKNHPLFKTKTAKAKTISNKRKEIIARKKALAEQNKILKLANNK